MDIFENKMDTKKFQSTNYLWNELGLNTPWSVGYVSTLIESHEFESKEAWRDFYYQSGAERLKQIETTCTPEQKKVLLDYTNSNPPLTKELKALNLQYGRTEAELNNKGKYLFEMLEKQGNPLGLTLGECAYAVKYRVMGETWNGIIARERNTVQTLQSLFPDLQFDKSEGSLDYQYGIDYEVYEGRDLVCALQIKPLSYKNGFAPAIMKAKRANEKKNAEYKKNFQSDVLYIFSNSKGKILNEDIVADIKKRSINRQPIFFDAKK